MTKMPTPTSPTLHGSSVYLYATDSGKHVGWLNAGLNGLGQVSTVPLDSRALSERIGATHPRSVFLDFSDDQAQRSTQLAASLRRDWPQLLLIGTGHTNETNTPIVALRAGVDDYLDLDGPHSEVLSVLQDLMARRKSTRAKAKGRTLALLGARAGMGVSTLACNLSALLEEHRSAMLARRAKGTPQRQGVALLDLGLPARDDLMYMGLKSEFSFVDGVQNLQRLDTTLLQTALVQHSSGAAVLPLPANLGEIRAISHADSGTLIQRLGDFFDVQIADLGGFTTVDFVAQVARNADQVWVVCDQSLGGIVSTAALLRELRERDVGTKDFSIVVNKFDATVNLPAKDIAAQLGLPLGHVLPARSSALLSAACQGQLLAFAARNDPYVQAVAQAARSLAPWIGARSTDSMASGAPARKTPSSMAQMLRKWIHRG